MNIRKSVDYSMMYAAIDVLMQSRLEQTKLFCEIGKVIDERPEKGAAVAAAEYINAAFPDRSGFSPRSLRRMRDFYRAYKNDPALMKMAMGISWSLNAVIIETCEDHDTRKWYVMACLKYGWSKQELFVQIKDNAHENTELILNETSDQDIVQNACFDRDWGCALLNAHNRIAVKAKLEETVAEIAGQFGTGVCVDWECSTPSLNNSAELIRRMAAVLSNPADKKLPKRAMTAPLSSEASGPLPMPSLMASRNLPSRRGMTR